ncbi:MAG: hypothetical protein HOQ35_04290 [Acidobacteriaceae bacterium]|nr:hypothetical protein [Acidobacteriaceae bacterium]
MEPKLYLRFEDLFDHKPTMDELVSLLRGIPLRHAMYRLTSLNQCLRVVMQDRLQDSGKLQEKMLAMHLDDECLARLKVRFPNARCDERPIILPEGLLNVMRIVIAGGDPEPFPVDEDDERIRYLIGRACLMVNSLLVSAEQAQALQAGTKNDQRIELMTQWLSSFELANPPRAEHLIPRLEIMYRILLRAPVVKARIAERTGGFDLEGEFASRLGITLEHWLFIVFTLYAYFLNIGSALEPDPNYMMITPSILRGDSAISQEELERVLAIIAAAPQILKEKMVSVRGTDARYDFVEFRSTPLVALEDNKLVPTDLTFMLEKCHTGVQWALHDALPMKLRQSLFNAWGALFEEYVHWLLGGMKTDPSVVYFPAPKWKKNGNESFDGIVLKGGVMIAAEYKGGFVARNARYSGDSSIFLADLDKKMTIGCQQLADKIGSAFAVEETDRWELTDMDTATVRAVLPVLVLQDHILRVPFLNWYLNQQFQRFFAEKKIRPGVVVRSLTVILIDDLESIVHSAESEQFDFIYALQNRTLRDPDVLGGLLEWLSQFKEFGRKPSARMAQILEQVTETITTFLFPGSRTHS